MDTKYMQILDAVEDHKEYDKKSKTTFYGVTSSAFETYKKKNKDAISKKALSKLTKSEAAKVADYYLSYLTERLDSKTNNRFSALDKNTKDGVLLMAYNTGVNKMPSTISTIANDGNKYDIIESMLSGEKNSSDDKLPNLKKGYLNRLYVSTKMIAGKNYDELDSAEKVHELYKKWNTRKETDLMLNCVKRIKNNIYNETEQNFQLDNFMEGVNNQQNTQQAVLKQNNTNTAQPTQKTQEEEDRGLIDNFINSFTGLFNRFTNKQKNTNIQTGEKQNDRDTVNNMQ